MSKKKAVYLKIEDWEEFQLKLDIALIVNDEAKEKKTPRMIWEERLLEHKLNVIEFEAEVAYMYRGFLVDKNTSSKELAQLAKDFKPGDKLQVFVVKKEKQ